MRSSFQLKMRSQFSEVLTPQQSISHYLAQVNFYVLNSKATSQLTLECHEPAYFLYIDPRANSCQLIYHPKGNHSVHISAGASQMLIMRLHTIWIRQRLEGMTEFKDFIHTSQSLPDYTIAMASCSIGVLLCNSFKRTVCHSAGKMKDRYDYLFVDNCILRYYNNLAAKAQTQQYYTHKAAAIASFISENYASELVNDIPDLAARFLMSERHLARLAKMAFGVSLHTQVTKIRMNSSLQYLMTSTKPVQEIAMLSGYREPYHFNKAFKKYFGISPKYMSKRYNPAI